MPLSRIAFNSLSLVIRLVTAKPDYVQRSAFHLSEETHGGEEVAVYATGPWAHLFSGVHDQSYIPHVMAYAACVGRYSGDKCAVSSATTLSTSIAWVLGTMVAATNLL